MKPRYVTGWEAHRVIDTDEDEGVTVEVTLHLQTDRGPVFLILEPEPAANIGYDLIGEATGFAYNVIPDNDNAEGAS